MDRGKSRGFTKLLIDRKNKPISMTERVCMCAHGSWGNIVPVYFKGFDTAEHVLYKWVTTVFVLTFFSHFLIHAYTG